MQPQQLIGEDGESVGLAEFLEFLLGPEVSEVGGVDCLRDAEDAVRDGEAAAELGGILDVVDTVFGERRGCDG